MSKKVLRRIKLNIFFSMIYNAIGLTLGVLGLMTPIIAILFQEAGCITVVLSSTLLLWTKQVTLLTNADSQKNSATQPTQNQFAGHQD